ncbi:MAG: hypothetical protein P9L92_14995 [Candidatus Electryonea clarkiae]|nr:hypothetical protein [Candidatus Electryonea clarkiae]MDP8288976.1 hypothetical protein [Candidatus Electryonea clarkiae]
MYSDLVSSKNNQGLRVLDPDLPFLASEAAIDLDNLLLKKAQDFTAIRRLAKQLANSMELDQTGTQPRSLMDPATLTVLGVAFGDAVRNHSLHTIEDLLGETTKIARLLSDDNLENNPEELEQARDICVALSKSVMAYHKSIRDLHPSHPFRR